MDTYTTLLMQEPCQRPGRDGARKPTIDGYVRAAASFVPTDD